jgi:3-isopropylmalate dehydrogenase
MKRYTIAVLQGDGAGSVLASFWAGALPRLAEKHGFGLDCRVHPFGKSAAGTAGTPVPAATLDAVRIADAALLFGVDSQGIPSPVGTLRKTLRLYADVRPVKSRPGRPAFKDGLDMVFIRESTQGFLADRNCYAGQGEWMSDPDSAFSLRVITREASLRIARFAFAYAAANGRKTVTALHKAPIFRMTCGLFLEACREAAREYPGIALEEELADNAAGRLIREPERFDVLLTTNLFGDILSDEAAVITGSIGMLPSASLGEGTRGLYEPIHGSAPDIAGQDKANPLATILSVAMMLRHTWQLETEASAVEAAVHKALQDGYRTGDIMEAGKTLVGCRRMGDLVVERV